MSRMKEPHEMSKEEVSAWLGAFQSWDEADMDRAGLPYITAMVKRISEQTGVGTDEVWLYLSSMSGGGGSR